MRINPIEHLSGRNYRKKKRYKLIALALVVLAAGAALFYVAGKNLRYVWFIKSGISHYEKGKYSRALSDFNRALNIKPSGALALDGLGSIAVKQNDFEKADKYFTEAITAGLKYSRMIDHTKFGHVFLDAGLYKNAEAEFSHSVRINPTDYKGLYGLGCCLHAAGKVDQAITYYTKALTYSPKFTPARKNLSLAEDDKNKGAIYYLYDRNGEPLARYNLIKSGSQKTFILDQRAAHITGFDDEKRGTKEGIEKYLEQYIPGNRIYLTIDTKVQNSIARALGWYKGSVVVIKPQTGEILGLYNQPTFRPNTISAEWYKVKSNANKPLLNRALEKLYEPGSIAKIITVAAALENQVNEKDIFPIRCAGSTGLNDQTFWCWQKHGKITSISHAIDTSCNIGAAYIGFAVGGPRLSEYNNRFWFNQPIDLGFTEKLTGTKISIPVIQSASPRMHDSRYELAMHACGLTPSRSQPYTITPLHAAMMAAAVANNGVMMKPYMIKEIRNINGKVIYSSVPQEAKRSITASTAAAIKELMIHVVEKGIGKKAQVKGMRVAGKTGTSGSSATGLHAWFISFAPADAPEYALAVVGDSEGKGMTVAAPVVGEIYKDLFQQ